MSLSATKIVPSGDRFEIDADNSLLLSLRVRGGIFLDGTGLRSVANATLTLTASATNYVEVNTAGVISTNTTSFTAGYTQLYIVTTGATVITGVQDFRTITATTGSLDGVNVANLAAANVVGAIPVWHMFTLAAGANADNDIVLTHKTRIIDAFVVLRGAGVASSVLTVKNTATAISSAISTAGSDQAVIRTTTIDDAAWEIAAGGTLRATSSGGVSQPAMTVYVLGVRVA